MIKIRVEATDIFAEVDRDNVCSVEIVTTNVNSDAPISEFVDLFYRAMIGLSFTKQTIVEGLENKVEEEKEEEC